jgi:Protein of unknown function (DUF3987)
LPPAFVAGAGLAAAASALGGGAELSLGGTFIERATLWVPLIGIPGAGKSPSLSLAYGPLQALAARAADPDTPLEEDITEVITGEATLEALARDLDEAEGSLGVLVDELAVLLHSLGEYSAAVAPTVGGCSRCGTELRGGSHASLVASSTTGQDSDSTPDGAALRWPPALAHRTARR